MKLWVLLGESDGGPTPGSLERRNRRPGSLRRWGRPPGWGGYQQGRREDGASAEATGPATHAATGPATHARTHAHPRRAYSPLQQVGSAHSRAPLTWPCRGGGGTQPRARYRPRRLGSASGFQPALCAHTLCQSYHLTPPTWEPCSSQIRVRNTCACGEKRRCRDLNPEQTVGILTIRFSPRSRDAATMCVLPAVRRLPPLTLAAFCFENRSLFGVHICVGMQAGIGGVNPSDSHSTDTA